MGTGLLAAALSAGSCTVSVCGVHRSYGAWLRGSYGSGTAVGGSEARGDLARGQVARILRSMAMMPVNRMVDETPVTATGLDPESAWWLRVLAETGPRREAALARLHELLVRVAPAEARRRGPRVRITGPELDDLAYQAAADAVMAVTGRLGQFRGESRFTTWACKFAIFEVSAKIGRHFWRHPGVPLDAEDWDRLPDRFGLEPARESEWRCAPPPLRVAGEDQRAPPRRAGRRGRRAQAAVRLLLRTGRRSRPPP